MKVLMTDNPRLSTKKSLETPSAMFYMSLDQLLEPLVHPKRELYFFCGSHKELAYRYTVEDCEELHPNDFKFQLFALDIDMRMKDKRVRWVDLPESLPSQVITLLRNNVVLQQSVLTVTSSGGIRVLFKTGKPMSARQWRWYYENIVSEFMHSLEGASVIKGGKIQFKLPADENGTSPLRTLQFIIDGRNPCSLTRSPFGTRFGTEVISHPYFAGFKNRNTLLVDRYGELQEQVKVIRLPEGATRVNYLNINQPPMPTKQDIDNLLVGTYRWPDNKPPIQGERELSIFNAVNRAKRELCGMLTPEQMYHYFYDAIKQMDSSGAVTDPHSLLWDKIRRGWLEAEKKPPTMYAKQLKNSNGLPIFSYTDFEIAMQPESLYEYTKSMNDKLFKGIDSLSRGILYANLPAGAGKSSAVAKFINLNSQNVIYVSKSNEHISQMRSKINYEVNVVMSYRYIISEALTKKEIIKKILAIYDDQYAPQYDIAMLEKIKSDHDQPFTFMPDMHVRRGAFISVKSFPEFLPIMYKIEAKKISTEHDLRIERMIQGHTTLITASKLKSCMGKTPVQMIADRKIIFDEATVEDMTLTLNKKNVYVRGVEYVPKIDQLDVFKDSFVYWLQKFPLVIINADKGLEHSLRYNGFPDVNIMGRDMSKVIDTDLHVVIAPHLQAGEPRAVYSELVNRSVYTLMTNGGLSKDNLVRVIGSNAYLNSRVVSVITYPTPEQIANFCFCTGLTPNESTRLLIDNSINQTVARNTGYRGYELIRSIGLATDRSIGEKNNEHIMVLPQSLANCHPDMTVITPNVWTSHSSNAPDRIAPLTGRLSPEIVTRAKLFHLTEGAHQFKSLFGNSGIELKEVKRVIDTDETLADFSIKYHAFEDGDKQIAIIRHTSLKDAVTELFFNPKQEMDMRNMLGKVYERITQAKVKQIGGPNAIKTFIRQESYRYGFQPVMTRNDKEIICRQELI